MSEVDYARLAHLMAVKAHLEIALNLLDGALLEAWAADPADETAWKLRQNDLIPIRRSALRRMDQLIGLEWER